MAVPVLVVTPNTSFGELICQVLEEAGNYSAMLAHGGRDALAYAKKKEFTLCILDAETQDVDIRDFVAAIQRGTSDISVIVIPGEGETTNLDNLRVSGYLSKPFYLPDLLVMVEETLKQSGMDVEKLKKTTASPPVPQRMKKGVLTAGPEWLKDAPFAAQHLTQLSLETSSQASIITRYDQVWANAGELPQEAVEELAQTVSRYFTDGGGSDLARFIHLNATNDDYMLYATGLGGEYVLALVFDAEMPFSKMRAQSSKMAQALSSPPERTVEEAGQPEEVSTVKKTAPPPTPQGWVPAYVPSSGEEGGPQVEEGEAEAEVTTQPSEGIVEGETTVSESVRREEAAETIPSKTTEQKRKFTLEPVSPAMYNLSYACVLIARMPEHHLTGEVASLLSDLVTQISVAFGWRLEHLSIRPDFFLWMVNVPPSTSPGYLMRIIRQHTSRRIFAEIPRLMEDNPSGDFWAPGYLIMSGPQLPPTQLVRDFISDTRKRQGISK